MSTRPLRFALLLTVLLLAAALALTFSRGATAGSLFQSSPLLPTDTPEAFFPAPLPTTELPLPEEPVVIVPEVVPVEIPDPASGGPGFLPAPTLTNPDDLLPGGPLTQVGQPPLSGAAAPVDEPDPTAVPDPPGAAELIDSALMAFGYAWLCCGAGLLGLAAVAFVWLMRRSARRRTRI